MAVDAPKRAVNHGLPSPMRSPTLSDAGMILPDFDAGHDRSLSPHPYIERPPSPPLLYPHVDPSHVKLASPPKSRRRTSTATKSPLSAQSSMSTLRNMDDAEAAARKTAPTIQDAINWTPNTQRRLSNASSSVHSDDLDSWPGFDSHDAFDDSGLGIDEHDKHVGSPSMLTNGDDDMDNAQSPIRHLSGSSEDDDEYYSAALSRRAEIILANAKKRLNVMEGNLRGARESLVISPTFNTAQSASELSLHINAARERDRRLYAGIGPIPPRMHPYRTSLLAPSPGHLRGLSENSLSVPFSSPSGLTRTPSNKRASSAFGHASGPWAPDSVGQGRFPIKESRSFEIMRDPRSTWPAEQQQQQQHQVRASSRSSRSPPALETLPEDEDDPRVHRSSSAASGLRDQMNDLKGRISSLKLKAQEDQLRRRSIQNMRTPSPFNNAQEWYAGSDNYQASGSPVAANAGLGIKTESPSRRALFDEDHQDPTAVETVLNQQNGERSSNETNGLPTSAPYYGGQDEEAYEDDQDVYETDEGDFASVNSDVLDAGPESVYEDAVYEMPATARHEDRVDAFDYEHFFLHSAMGTYSLEGRRASSAGSDSSTATTRPVTAVQSQDELSETERRFSYHSRTASADSVSTMASFATAAENHSDDEDEEANEQMEQFSRYMFAQQPHTLPARPVISTSPTSLRSDSAINMRRGNGTLSSQSQGSTPRVSSSPADLASGLQVSKIFSVLTEPSSPSQEEPRLALSEQEKQLIYSLAASFQQVCADLQNSAGDQYERKAWRRRLDDARRVLNGEAEDVEDDQSF